MGFDCPVCAPGNCAQDGEVLQSVVQASVDAVILMCDFCGFDCNIQVPGAGACISMSFINSLRERVDRIYAAVLKAGIDCPDEPTWRAGCWVSCEGLLLDAACRDETEPGYTTNVCTGGGPEGRLGQEVEDPCPTAPDPHESFVVICETHIAEIECWALKVADCCFTTLCCACFDCCYGPGDTADVTVEHLPGETRIEMSKCGFPGEFCIITWFGDSASGIYEFFGCAGGFAIFTPTFERDPDCDDRPTGVLRDCGTGSWGLEGYDPTRLMCNEDPAVISGQCVCFIYCDGGGPGGVCEPDQPDPASSCNNYLSEHLVCQYNGFCECVPNGESCFVHGRVDVDITSDACTGFPDCHIFDCVPL